MLSWCPVPFADSEPSTAQTPDGTVSCRRWIRGPDALLVFRDNFGGHLPSAKECIRVKLAAAFPEAPGLPRARLEGYRDPAGVAD